VKAAVYYENGPPTVLRYEDVADPVCYPSGIVIRVEAVSIEGGDTLNRLGGALMTKPHIVGYQAAGEIVEVGSDVHNMKVGQKVVTTGFNGSHAELRVVPARTAWVIPKGADVRAAAVVPVPFGTAHDCLFEFGKLKAGETVLVQAGASGVGVAAIQLAKRAGARVLATASSDERLERLKPLGLDEGINYKRDNVVQQVMKVTDNQGVNLVVDPVGGPTLETSFAALGYRGRVSLVGQAGRETSRVDVSSLMAGNRSLTGVFLGAEIATDRVHDNIQQLVDDVAAGRLRAIIDRTFSLKDAAAAHAYIESRKAVGRVLLIP
jgi:NADPH2:quinone reductase